MGWRLWCRWETRDTQRSGETWRSSREISHLSRMGSGWRPGWVHWPNSGDANELVALHAMAILYRTRSHFDGQAILETGLALPDGGADGWLNRLLQVMEGKRSAIAVAAGMPRSLTGTFPVSTWSPATLGAVDDGYLDRLHFLYRSDPVLMNRFEAALQQRDATGDIGGDMAGGGREARRGVASSASSRLRRS